ncbi:phosphotransferase [Psychromarinibacter sp. C21-152]|uniref:Phosphotransferase n=1 Tax=Psychromarinibacter sediminicola TaxID=3033385 RepID=A0AAE3NSL6_9RHOB|nr:phosphotransferase [Psychromarinibacter sediminicola]MDF0601301.1 phosphotransferase [Psychromarinibacter sediminicola]
MADRSALIQEFLDRAGWGAADRLPLAGDASARRYLRLASEGQSAVLMDASPEAGQDVRPFRHLAGHLRAAGLSAPEVFAADDAAGLLLLEDLGDAVFARLIETDASVEDGLYSAAIDMLVALRDVPVPDGLVTFTPEHMAGMIDPVLDWYVAPTGRTVPEAERQAIRDALQVALAECVDAETVLCLRDCHAENLIWLPERDGMARVGILDFQDAVAAHPAYDVVSLLQDARRDLPAALTDRMIDRYVSASGSDPAAIRAGMAALGAQRHLRIIGIFGRLSLQFGKTRYLAFLPRVWDHLQTCLAHLALSDLSGALADVVPEPTEPLLNRLKPHVPA